RAPGSRAPPREAARCADRAPPGSRCARRALRGRLRPRASAPRPRRRLPPRGGRGARRSPAPRRARCRRWRAPCARARGARRTGSAASAPAYYTAHMKWLLLALGLVALPAVSQEPPAWFGDSLLELRDDVTEAARQGKRVMLYFGQDGCPYCKQLMEVNFRQASIAAKAQKNLVALAINIWGDREVIWTDGESVSEKRLAAKLKVQFTPTLLFLDEQGGVALRMNGYYPPHEFDAALDYVAGRMEKKVAFADYLKSKPRPPARATLNPQGFFLSAPYDLRRSPGGKPLAVLFETTQCAQCDELHAVAFKRQEVLHQIARFDVVRFSLSEHEQVMSPDGKSMPAAAWAKTLGVGYVPAMVLFDAHGREAFRTEAYLRPFHLAGALDYVSSGAYTREPSFQRFLQTRSDAMRSRGERVDLWN